MQDDKEMRRDEGLPAWNYGLTNAWAGRVMMLKHVFIERIPAAWQPFLLLDVIISKITSRSYGTMISITPSFPPTS